MKNLLASAAIAAFGALPFGAAPAAAYQIDCAILLCLAGGWPSAGACIPACARSSSGGSPLGRSSLLFKSGAVQCAPASRPRPTSPLSRLYDIASQQADSASGRAINAVCLYPKRSRLRASGRSYTTWPAREPISISAIPSFDFVRSIRVFDVDWWEYDHENQHGDHDLPPMETTCSYRHLRLAGRFRMAERRTQRCPRLQ